MILTIPTPDKFLEVRIKIVNPLPGLTGLCAGYEDGYWRCEQLASHLMEWLPEFALAERERVCINSANLMKFAAKSASAIYTTINTDRRGEIGEIILHAAIRHEFGSIPAISKIFYKDSENDTIKGFDSVHIVEVDDELELWLGESKFYTDVNAAISDVVKELEDHMDNDYLRKEFAAILNKIDPDWPYANQLMEIIDRNRSLDLIFNSLCIPIFITYESSTIPFYNTVSEEFKMTIIDEMKNHHKTFCGKDLPPNIKIQLLLLPIYSKSELIEYFDEKLKACQIIAN